MNITSYQNNIRIPKRPNSNCNQRSFRAAQSSLKTFSKKPASSVEYGFRVIGNKLFDLLESSGSKKLTRSIANLIPQRNRIYLEQLAEIGRLYATKKTIDVNIEDKILEEIAQKGDSTIFIMNHCNQIEDPQMLAVLNTLLAEAYKETEQEAFPLPKIILNEDILKTMNPTKRKAYENFGAVGIDASVVGGDKGTNARAFLPLIKDFVRNKCNIFIFPEGRLAVRKDLDLHRRFQIGVANLVNKMLGLKKEIRVVPVGFAYGKGKQKELNAMQIGSPIIIKRSDNTTTVTKGDIEKNPESCLYNFFDKRKNITDIAITSEGVPVTQAEVPEYLKTILCENLEINSELAQKKLEIPLDENEIELR